MELAVVRVEVALVAVTLVVVVKNKFVPEAVEAWLIVVANASTKLVVIVEPAPMPVKSPILLPPTSVKYTKPLSTKIPAGLELAVGTAHSVKTR